MMNGPNGIPLVGQRKQQQQTAAHQVVTSTYLNLIPVVAASVLANTEMYADREEIPGRIADEAWGVTRAAVKKLGIEIPAQPESEAKTAG
jgi:hypothetical protein